MKKTKYWLVDLEDPNVYEFESLEEMKEWMIGTYSEDSLPKLVNKHIFLFTSAPLYPYFEITHDLKMKKEINE
jgi:hypothetical protein